MSSENVELLRRITVAFNRGDLEGPLALADPRQEFDHFRDSPQLDWEGAGFRPAPSE